MKVSCFLITPQLIAIQFKGSEFNSMICIITNNLNKNMLKFKFNIFRFVLTFLKNKTAFCSTTEVLILSLITLKSRFVKEKEIIDNNIY